MAKGVVIYSGKRKACPYLAVRLALFWEGVNPKNMGSLEFGSDPPCMPSLLDTWTYGDMALLVGLLRFIYIRSFVTRGGAEIGLTKPFSIPHSTFPFHFSFLSLFSFYVISLSFSYLFHNFFAILQGSLFYFYFFYFFTYSFCIFHVREYFFFSYYKLKIVIIMSKKRIILE